MPSLSQVSIGGRKLREANYRRNPYRNCQPMMVKMITCSAFLEPIREVLVGDQRLGASRLSMRRIIARRTNAAALRVWRSSSRASLRFRLIHASVLSTIQRFGNTTKR